MADPRTGGHFDSEGNWHDDHPEHLADLNDGAFLVAGLIRLALHFALWGGIVGAAWIIFKLLVRAAL